MFAKNGKSAKDAFFATKGAWSEGEGRWGKLGQSFWWWEGEKEVMGKGGTWGMVAKKLIRASNILIGAHTRI